MHGYRKRKAHTDICNGADGLTLSLAPAAGGKDQRAFADALHEHLQQKLDLIDQRYAGKRLGRPVGKHDVVGKVNGEDHQILQGDDARHGEKGFVKAFFAHKGFHGTT